MNVTVENLAPCRKLVRVEVDAQEVDAEYVKVTLDFQKNTRLPGFRAGKAPLTMVATNYAKDIEKEVKKHLIGNSYRLAVKDNNLDVVGYPSIEEIQFGRGQALQFAATIDTAPEFELPEYKGLPAKINVSMVTDADVEKAMESLRNQRSTYADLDRPARQGDFLVVNYTGQCEDKPITEIAPTAQGLAERKNFWLHLDKTAFIPGFSEQLNDAKVGETRTVTVDFPADFVESTLSGKKGVFQVEVLQVKERVMPELNNELAKAYGAESIDKLREGVRTDLDRELKFKQNSDLEAQLLKALLDRVTCDLPESVVQAETRNVVYDLVRQNQERGVPRELIEEKKEEIYSFANNNAKDRVKTSFLLSRIAAKEGIKPTQQEIAQRALYLAQQYRITPAKFFRQLEERNGFAEIAEKVVNEKVVDLLKLHAKVEEVPTAPAES